MKLVPICFMIVFLGLANVSRGIPLPGQFPDFFTLSNADPQEVRQWPNQRARPVASEEDFIRYSPMFDVQSRLKPNQYVQRLIEQKGPILDDLESQSEPVIYYDDTNKINNRGPLTVAEKKPTEAVESRENLMPQVGDVVPEENPKRQYGYIVLDIEAQATADQDDVEGEEVVEQESEQEPPLHQDEHESMNVEA